MSFTPYEPFIRNAESAEMALQRGMNVYVVVSAKLIIEVRFIMPFRPWILKRTRKGYALPGLKSEMKLLECDKASVFG